MNAISPTCAECQSPFEITKEDLAFLEKISPSFNGKKFPIPPPTLCPDCRLQRRLAHRNEKTLFNRTCDLSGKTIVSVYHSGSPFVVYGKDEWWSDRWDASAFGKEFDFSKPFFGQFASLRSSVPRMSLQQDHNENSEYTNNVSYLKNCYLLFSADKSKDCCYGIWVERSRDCFDNFMIDECERTYESIFSNKIYNASFIYSSVQCRDSAFLQDCHGCSDCLMCSGLRNKQYCIANAQYTKEEYERKRREFPLSSHRNLSACKERFAKLLAESPHPALRTHGRIADSSGDFLSDTENCTNCYELQIAKDCANTIGFRTKDTRDCTYVNGDFAYESCECFPTPFHSAFNVNCYTGNDLLYCDLCMNNCQNLFGCVGMKKARYCILNKQYSKEEYERLVPKIIEHMMNDEWNGAAMNRSEATGSWGEFFPANLSPFPYNISEAQQYFPLTEKQAASRGMPWLDEEDPGAKYLGPRVELPDDIGDTGDDICTRILTCEASGKQYKIIPQELKFYRSMGLPVPRRCPNQRHVDRLALRNPRKLWKRPCMKCNMEMQTTYSPDRPETVYCESCYVKEIY